MSETEQASETYEFPASFAQRRLWLLDRLDPGLTTYNVPWTVGLSGPLDPSALQAALAALVARHEVLRTVFREEAGQPVQVVAPAAELDWRVVDLTGSADPGAAARARADELARTQFDLGEGPLLRTELLRLAPDEHVLVLVYHHIVADGWSFRILIGELADGYAGRPVPEPPIQYADFALWQLEQSDGGLGDAQRYWLDELAGADLVLDLPADRARPEQPSFRGGSRELTVPSDLTRRLREFAAARGTTLFTALLAGFGATVARLTGRTDLLVGVPVAGRQRAETEQVVGLFMNTLPVRLRPNPGDRYADLVGQLHDTVARALAHQEMPFERIVELCRVPRDPARSPVTQVMFQIEELPPPFETGGLRWRPEMIDNGGSKLDLTLLLAERGDELTGQLVYAVDLFDRDWARQFGECLLTVLDSALADPGRPLAELELVAPAQYARLTGDWATGPALPVGAPTAIELLARRWPDDGPARIAGALRALGVGPESRVGLCLPRGPELIPAVLGIWWAGASYVPLDPGHPPARLASVITDAGVEVVLGTSEGSAPWSTAVVPDSVAASGVTVLELAAALAADPVARRPVPAPAAAYTIFTSGSTGRPKGVTVSQGNVAALLRAFAELLPIGPADHLVAVTTLAFDISVLELLLPPLIGARVTVADAQTATDAGALRRLLARCGATALQATPATWRALVTSGGVPAGVRLRISGGEPLPRDLADELLSDGAQLWNVYGPTETTVWSTATPVPPEGPVLIGAPIPGTRCYVLDAALRPVPPGVVGQVYLAGAGVARGYLGQPALTAQRFVPDPFDDAGGRLYVTGDLARWRRDGGLELLGRVDHQVKIRGFRIEPAEVEAALRACPGVTDAVVTVPPGPDPRLVAYVVGGDDRLRERLAAQLPGYLVPALVVPLAALPRTANGKLDRAALPAPDFTAAAGPVYRAPRDDLERRLVGVWQDLLRLAEPPGIDDNFFTLGGHSLTATTLIARLRAEFGVDVALRELFRGPTVAGLARAVSATQAAGPVPGSFQAVGADLDELDDDQLDDLLQELMG
ncbi:non-ribosomal peptide synthetase [Solwaraspora sp. WMMB335]|uniref:non-ribosomal peptide synthetase n=1 Tax=Solwaraspora sp. WMMB335 TaxID=3404118 RepID=UPI003B93018F